MTGRTRRSALFTDQWQNPAIDEFEVPQSGAQDEVEDGQVRQRPEVRFCKAARRTRKEPRDPPGTAGNAWAEPEFDTFDGGNVHDGPLLKRYRRHSGSEPAQHTGIMPHGAAGRAIVLFSQTKTML